MCEDLLNALLEVIAQACHDEYRDGKNIVSHHFLSAYEDALELLERMGYAKLVGQIRYELIWPEDKELSGTDV